MILAGTSYILIPPPILPRWYHLRRSDSCIEYPPVHNLKIEQLVELLLNSQQLLVRLLKLLGLILLLDSELYVKNPLLCWVHRSQVSPCR